MAECPKVKCSSVQLVVCFIYLALSYQDGMYLGNSKGRRKSENRLLDQSFRECLCVSGLLQ